MKVPVRLAVLISGGGRTLQNLQERIQAGTLPAQLVVALSSRPGVPGIARSLALGVPTLVIDRKQAGGVEEFSRAVWEAILPYRPDLVVLGGFLSLLRIPPEWYRRVINIHPALLPAFGGRGYYGDRVHRAVLRSGAKVSGCTVHFVDNEYDHGPIILQQTVPVLAGDTVLTLAQRVFAAECAAYPQAITSFAAGRLGTESPCGDSA